MVDHSKNEPGADAGIARTHVAIASYSAGGWRTDADTLAVERPLEIHVAGAEPLITMRTPGHDHELTAGLLHGEGVVRAADDIVYLEHSAADVMRVMLKPAARERLERIERNTLATSACGVCGKPSFREPRGERLAQVDERLHISPEWLLGLPERMREGQRIFEATGGLHAAGLFAAGGNLLHLREDVGRHNALDKLIGRALLDERLPLSQAAVMLSGRASFELLQKSAAAGVPVVCAISAPSSFAVELAQRFDVTLVGFLRGERFNIYSGEQRIVGAADRP